MFSDSTDISERQWSSPIMKIAGTGKSKSFSTSRITQSPSTKRRNKTLEFHKVFSSKGKSA
jgi:hypothetical protein